MQALQAQRSMRKVQLAHAPKRKADAGADSGSGSASCHTSDSSTDDHKDESGPLLDTERDLDQGAAAGASNAAGSNAPAADSGVLGGTASCSISTGCAAGGPLSAGTAAAATAGPAQPHSRSRSGSLDITGLAAAAATAATACSPNRPPQSLLHMQVQVQQQQGALGQLAQSAAVRPLLQESDAGAAHQKQPWGMPFTHAGPAGQPCGPGEAETGWAPLASPQPLGQAGSDSRARISDSSSRQTPQSWPALKPSASMLSSEVSSCSHGPGTLRNTPNLSAPLMGQESAMEAAATAGAAAAAAAASAAAAAAMLDLAGPLGRPGTAQQQKQEQRGQEAEAQPAAAPGPLPQRTAGRVLDLADPADVHCTPAVAEAAAVCMEVNQTPAVDGSSAAQHVQEEQQQGTRSTDAAAMMGVQARTPAAAAASDADAAPVLTKQAAAGGSAALSEFAALQKAEGAMHAEAGPAVRDAGHGSTGAYVGQQVAMDAAAGAGSGLRTSQRSISLPANFVAPLPSHDDDDCAPEQQPDQHYMQQAAYLQHRAGPKWRSFDQVMPAYAADCYGSAGGSFEVHPGALICSSAGPMAIPRQQAPQWGSDSAYASLGDSYSQPGPVQQPQQRHLGAARMAGYGSSGSMSSHSGHFASSGTGLYMAGPRGCAPGMGPPAGSYPGADPYMPGSYGPPGVPTRPVPGAPSCAPLPYAGSPAPCDCWECRMAAGQGRAPPGCYAGPEPGFRAPGYCRPSGQGFSSPYGPCYSSAALPGYSRPYRPGYPAQPGPGYGAARPRGPGYVAGPTREPLLGELPYYAPPSTGSLPNLAPTGAPGGPGPLRMRSLPAGAFAPGLVNASFSSSRAHPYEGGFGPLQRQGSGSSARLAASGISGSLKATYGSSGGYGVPPQDSLPGQWPPIAGGSFGGLLRTGSMECGAFAPAHAAAEGEDHPWQPPDPLGRAISAPSNMRRAVDEALGPAPGMPAQYGPAQEPPVLQQSKSGHGLLGSSSGTPRYPAPAQPCDSSQYMHDSSSSQPGTPMCAAAEPQLDMAAAAAAAGTYGAVVSPRGMFVPTRRLPADWADASKVGYASGRGPGYRNDTGSAIYGRGSFDGSSRTPRSMGREALRFRGSLDEHWQQQQQDAAQQGMLPDAGTPGGLPQEAAPGSDPAAAATGAAHAPVVMEARAGSMAGSFSQPLHAQQVLPSVSTDTSLHTQQLRRGLQLPVLQGVVVGSCAGRTPTSAAAAAAAAAATMELAPAGDELLMALDSDTSFGDLAGSLFEEMGQEGSLAAIDSLLSPMEVEADMQDMVN